MESRKSLLYDEDLQEEEVWAVVKEREDSSLKMKRRAKEYSSSGSGSGSGSSSAWHVPAAVSRVLNIPRSSNGGCGAHMPQKLSAPVNITDWSKIHKNKELRDDDESNGDGCVDDDDERVPPHEYIDRKLARSHQTASFSMCEGVGRTLKGRDLSILRNAILTKTGFIE